MHAGDTWTTNLALHFAVPAAGEMGFVASDLYWCSSKEVVARWQCSDGLLLLFECFDAMEMKSVRV